jgi:hypothetical protein
MSALKQLLECQDLKRYIREFIPPHPISTIIEEGYFKAFVKNMDFDCVEIIRNTRLYPIPTEPKGQLYVALEFEKDLINQIEKKLIDKTFYRPQWLWNVEWITECKIKRLNHIQDGLKLQHPTYFEIFKFKTDIDELTYMKGKLYKRCRLIKTCSSVMRDYHKIYKVDDEVGVNDKVYQVRFELEDGDIHFVEDEDGDFEFETIEEAKLLFDNYEKENDEVVYLTATPYMNEDDYEALGLTYEIEYLMTK